VVHNILVVHTMGHILAFGQALEQPSLVVHSILVGHMMGGKQPLLVVVYNSWIVDIELDKCILVEIG